MNKLLKNYPAWPYGHDVGALLLRLFLGLSMLLAHGMGKWDRLFGGEPIKFADPIGVGPEVSLGLTVLAEVVCSVLLVLGLLSRWALVPLIITMLVATFVIHAGDGFGTLEKPLLYLVGYLSLLFTGPGRFSVDGMLSKK